MDKRQAKKLNRLIWGQRIRFAAPFAIIAVVIGSLYGLYLYDQQNATRDSSHAVVDSWTRLQAVTGNSSYILQVTLADRSTTTATASRYGRTPTAGERYRSGENDDRLRPHQLFLEQMTIQSRKAL